MTNTSSQDYTGMRIAKAMSRAGLCSRREAERWIDDGRVAINGDTLDTPAYKISPDDDIRVDGKPLQSAPQPRLWLYHKPVGEVTTHDDPQNRSTVFDGLDIGRDHIISVGRLDLNSEGLLLLTNHGGLARALEHPKNEIPRKYRVRVRGHIDEGQLKSLKKGVTVDGVRYGPIDVHWKTIKEQSSNNWLTVTLHEGKNREIRKVMTHCGLQVNRLIRQNYGDLKLGNLKAGAVTEVSSDRVAKLIKDVGGVE